jgi:hypothetical protein
MAPVSVGIWSHRSFRGKSSSQATLRWREMDSNFRFPAMVSFVVVPFRGVSPIPR